MIGTELSSYVVDSRSSQRCLVSIWQQIRNENTLLAINQLFPRFVYLNTFSLTTMRHTTTSKQPH